MGWSETDRERVLLSRIGVQEPRSDLPAPRSQYKQVNGGGGIDGGGEGDRWGWGKSTTKEKPRVIINLEVHHNFLFSTCVIYYRYVYKV